MDEQTRTSLGHLGGGNKELQYQAYLHLMEVTQEPVDWAYEVWDDMVARLSHKDNHLRTIAAQILCNLARSDPESRILKDFPAIMAVTKDERFVTARHTLQAIWKIGLAGAEQRQMVVDDLAYRFRECITEKNCTLIRYDIIQDFRNLYDETRAEAVREKALALIETEEDVKYQKKYAGLWKYR